MTRAIDTAVLEQLACDLPKADLLLVLGTFEADMQRLGAALLAAGRAGDAEGWRRAAHGVAGAAGAVGAVEVERLARAAMAQPAIEPPLAAQEAGAMREAFRTALAELQAFLADGTSPK